MELQLEERGGLRTPTLRPQARPMRPRTHSCTKSHRDNHEESAGSLLYPADEGWRRR